MMNVMRRRGVASPFFFLGRGAIIRSVECLMVLCVQFMGCFLVLISNMGGGG